VNSINVYFLYILALIWVHLKDEHKIGASVIRNAASTALVRPGQTYAVPSRLPESANKAIEGQYEVHSNNIANFFPYI
jgi:hypothetical protein